MKFKAIEIQTINDHLKLAANAKSEIAFMDMKNYSMTPGKNNLSSMLLKIQSYNKED